jgi:hypothetical protein
MGNLNETPPAYALQGVFFMCRRNHLRGCLCLGVGIGMFVGYTLESWLISTAVGLGLISLGLLTLKKK